VKIQAKLTRETFDALATTLGVRWPDWYSRLVRTLLDAGCDVARELSYVCLPPDIVAEWTRCYREGRLTLNRREGTEERGPLVETSWPPSLVIVGHTGGGDLVIDTSANDGRFAIIDKEDHCLKPFVDIIEFAGSPEAFAQQCLDFERSRTPPPHPARTGSGKGG
jgi:hypothetical protein